MASGPSAPIATAIWPGSATNSASRPQRTGISFPLPCYSNGRAIVSSRSSARRVPLSKTISPSIPGKSGGFLQVPKGFWEHRSNRHRYLDWLGEQLGFQQPEDWSRLRYDDVSAYHGYGLLKHFQYRPALIDERIFVGTGYTPSKAWSPSFACPSGLHPRKTGDATSSTLSLWLGGYRTPKRSPARRHSPADSRRAGSVPPQGGAPRIIPLVGLRHLFGEPHHIPNKVATHQRRASAHMRRGGAEAPSLL